MQRSTLALCAALAAGAFAVACGGGDSAAPTNPVPLADLNPTPLPCNQERTLALTRELWVPGPGRTEAQTRYFDVAKKAGRNPPGANPAATRAAAMGLVDFTLTAFDNGQLIGGTSEGTQAKVGEFLTNILCLAALPPFDPGALGDGGAAEVVTPGSDETIVTNDGSAAVDVEPGSVTEPSLITIKRLPDTPWPLLTQLDQFPIFYEFHNNPGTPFEVPVIVSLCSPITLTHRDPARLRLAHNIAPFTMGSIEILEPVESDVIDCTDIGAGPSNRMQDLARGGLNLLRSVFTPAPLYAARKRFGTGGLSGSVRTFSPFGGVDPLVQVSNVTPLNQTAAFGELVAQAPTIKLRTGSGRVMVGVPVTFTVTNGDGTLGTTSTVTDALGRASSGSWRIGFTNPNTVSGSATGVPGTILFNNPVIFSATGFEP